MQVLDWPDTALTITLPKRPQLLTRVEVARILAACTQPKYRMMLTLCYGCGLRVSELVAVKVSDLDGERRLLRVEQGKGAKDRLVPISATLLEQLRTYWRSFRPEGWLFPGQVPGQPLCATSDCRTEAMGGLALRYDQCGAESPAYYSCRDRHCPRCQRQASQEWCERQRAAVLPVTYHHLVVTLPHVLNPWIEVHDREIYALLFQTVWATLSAFGADPKRLDGQRQA